MGFMQHWEYCIYVATRLQSQILTLQLNMLNRDYEPF